MIAGHKGGGTIFLHVFLQYSKLLAIQNIFQLLKIEVV